MSSFRASVFLLAVVVLLSVASTGAMGETVTITNIDFHGRPAIVLRNRVAEIVVVPQIGRVMRFGLLDEKGAAAHGPFWNHPQIGGAPGSGLQPDAEGWTNHGGDKSWPAPQSDWPQVTGRPWPPPTGFDATPYTLASTIRGGRVQIVSAVDPDYGIRVRRTIALDPRAPVMTIETTYQKVRGAPVRVAVWSITQLESPDRLFILLPPRPGRSFPNGYLSLLPDAPADLKIEGRVFSMIRDPVKKTMISSDGRALLWVGPDVDLLVEDKTSEPADTAAAAGGRNNDARSQIYTSQTYVELELLGRPRKLGPGAKAGMRARYMLIRRTKTDPRDEAWKVLAPRGGRP